MELFIFKTLFMARNEFFSIAKQIIRESEKKAREKERLRIKLLKAQEQEERRQYREAEREARRREKEEQRLLKEQAFFEMQQFIDKAEKKQEQIDQLNDKIDNFLRNNCRKKISFEFSSLLSEIKLNSSAPEKYTLNELPPTPLQKRENDILFLKVKTRHKNWKKEIIANPLLRIIITNKSFIKFIKICSKLSQLLDIIFGVLIGIISIFSLNIIGFFIFTINLSPISYFGFKSFKPFITKIFNAFYILRLILSSIFIVFCIKQLTENPDPLTRTTLIILGVFLVNIFIAFIFERLIHKLKESRKKYISNIKTVRQKYFLQKNQCIFECKKWIVDALTTYINNINIVQNCKIQHQQRSKTKEANIQKINNYQKDLINHKKEATEIYFYNILQNIQQPINYEELYDINYEPRTKILEIKYFLPNFEVFPKINKITYVKTRKEIKETCFSEKILNKRYETYIYQLIFVVISIVYNADKYNTIDSIVFNGIVSTINKSNGKTDNICIASLLLNKKDYLSLNLCYVDPKETFNLFKGIAGTRLNDVIAIPPIMDLDTNDHRIIDSYNVLKDVNKGVNLAAIYWKDFENLIRELFEKEFSHQGSSVKVTQSSRDGGVDVIAFDADPIRGGKIVIQAKRYTNTVGVSAVRDLYGTLISEGALKGILITTSNYGKDAYDFAKDKPITLLNGNNLLHLIRKNGKEAYIDLKEAKIMINNAM